jgi:predicted PurR-regulated permease PerM
MASPLNRPLLSVFNLFLLVATGFLAILLWQLRGLLVTLTIAVVLAAAIVPLVDVAERWRFPRWLAAIGVYLALIASLVGVGLLIGPTLITQIETLVRILPVYIDNLFQLVEQFALKQGITESEIEQFFDLQALTGWIIRSGQQLLVSSYDITTGILGGIFNSILAFVLSGYMVAGRENLISGLVNLFPQPWNDRLADQVEPIARRMGGYIRGRVLVSAILSVAITIGLGIFGLSQFALALGAIAGFTNLIPFIGPILGVIPALVVAISQGGWTFLWVLLLFIIVQNVETYVLDPLLVGSSVQVHPLYQLLAVLGGTQVLGILGAVIVPPWIAGASVLLENLYVRPKLLAEGKVSESGVGSRESGVVGGKKILSPISKPADN